tara:strand:+ start:8938 stop:9606 length:669 start_codon:yes stop_codon:yes gene_type:complete
MSFYSIEDFEFNTSWGVAIIPYRGDLILHIDEIYKKPHKVYEYLKECPIRAHKLTEADPTSKNGKLFYDGQHLVDNRCITSRTYLYDKILEFYCKEKDENYPPVSKFNQFRLVEDYPGDDVFFTPHVDGGLLNCLTYMNPSVGSDAGTMFYLPASDEVEEMLENETEHANPWKDSSMFTPDLAILSKFNSMVVFPGHIPHGQIINDNRFKEQTRFTEVAFFK